VLGTVFKEAWYSILWHIVPFLRNIRETKTPAVARLWPERNNGNTVGSGVFYVVRFEAISLDRQSSVQFIPCGGGVEYVHRSPASRRRRRKWKSQI
jgi:hypothetical protein